MDLEDTEIPELRTHVASNFFCLIERMTTASVGGGSDTFGLKWDGKNDDEKTESRRQDLYHRAYQIIKGGTGGYGRKKS